MLFSLSVRGGRQSLLAQRAPSIAVINRTGAQGSAVFELSLGGGDIDRPNFLSPKSDQVIEFVIAGEGVPVTFIGLEEDDHLKLRIVSQRRIEVRVQHLARAKKARVTICVVRCADGTEGSPCVTCRSRQRAVRVCC
jgi:hypothetical protein